jgi:diaminohydroxyphosphoribosylaminopyrimidine deaminase/5-amino-6-(5-phosphoribosylamino)uracil reductase
MDDIKYMKAALGLSKRGTGFTEPNPLVGAVVVKNGRIISTGYHARFGDAHAERGALAGVNEPGTTLYVTLEPCVHHGKTPPCTDLILEKKVKRVVVAVGDPNPRVAGKGIQLLRQEGVEVQTGLLQRTGMKINRHYLKYITTGMPYVTLKSGISIDGKLTDKHGQSQWITGPELRAYSRGMRGEFSAIMAGAGTVRCDNPRLTIRENAWAGKKLRRVILDSNNTLDSALNIFQEREQFPLILFSSTTAANRDPHPCADHHFFVSPNAAHGGLNLVEILEHLHRLGIASVLVEGGGALTGSFLAAGLYDEIILFTADKLIGGRESVQLFPGGASISNPVTLDRREILSLDTGYIVRGFKG